MAGLGMCAKPDTRVIASDAKPVADSNDSNGPTIMLSYNTLKPLKSFICYPSKVLVALLPNPFAPNLRIWFILIYRPLPLVPHLPV